MHEVRNPIRAAHIAPAASQARGLLRSDASMYCVALVVIWCVLTGNVGHNLSISTLFVEPSLVSLWSDNFQCEIHCYGHKTVLCRYSIDINFPVNETVIGKWKMETIMENHKKKHLPASCHWTDTTSMLYVVPETFPVLPLGYPLDNRLSKGYPIRT